MCRFCEEFERAIFTAVKEEREHRYSVQFIDHTMIDGDVRGVTMHYMGRIGMEPVGFPLKYCPECGVRLAPEY